MLDSDLVMLYGVGACSAGLFDIDDVAVFVDVDEALDFAYTFMGAGTDFLFNSMVGEAFHAPSVENNMA